MNNTNIYIFDEYTVYDSKHCVLEYVTQWDSGLSVLIDSDTVSKWGTDGTYYFHFQNKSIEEALVVPTEWDNGALIAKIPNKLLQSPYNIIVHVYNQNGDIGKTVASLRIPMRAGKKPSDYLYVENINSVSSTELEELRNKTQHIIDNGQAIVDSGDLLISSGDSVTFGVFDDDKPTFEVYDTWEKFLAGIKITDSSIELKVLNGNGIKINKNGIEFIGVTNGLAAANSTSYVGEPEPIVSGVVSGIIGTPEEIEEDE